MIAVKDNGIGFSTLSFQFIKNNKLINQYWYKKSALFLRFKSVEMPFN